MSTEATKNRFFYLNNTIGRSAVSAMFPNDIETYITILELVDGSDRVVEYFLFPINPSSISEDHTQIINIKKTAGGISTTSTNTFMPKVINLQGDFGRKFKILIGGDYINFSAFNFSQQLVKNFNNNVFSNTIKTGYGCIKILQRIIEKSNQLDKNGSPYFLHLYNLSFGTSYLVKCIGQPTFSCNVEKNMIWQYQMQFQALAPLDQMENHNDLSNLKQLGISLIQKGLNNALASIQSSLQ